MSDEQAVTEGGAKVSVSIWTTARGAAQWRVRLTEEADEELADLVVGRAVRAFNRVEEELEAAKRAPRPAFVGPEYGTEEKASE
jgi:hypothetical protein